MATIEYEDRYRTDLGCHVQKLDYDFWKHRGVLWMAAWNCTDMSGCIRLFRAIDPEVEFITTMAGEEKDTCYESDPGGLWRCITADGLYGSFCNITATKRNTR